MRLVRSLRLFLCFFIASFLALFGSLAQATLPAAVGGDIAPAALRHQASSTDTAMAVSTETAVEQQRQAAVTASQARLSSIMSTTGTRTVQKLLVIRVSFTDIQANYSQQQLEERFFGSSGSVASYYRDNSYGSMQMEPALPDQPVIDVSLDYEHPDFGFYVGGGSSANLATDALMAVHDQGLLDMSDFDTNGDGFVVAAELGIVFIVAGYENAYLGSATSRPRVWAHQTSFGALYLDDVLLNGYVMFGERHEQHLATIGVICHELGHLLLGLPDLYTSTGTASGVDRWGLMSLGGWNGLADAGDSPSNMMAWSKDRSGFLQTDQVETGVTEWQVDSASSEAVALEIPVDEYQHGERVLLEYRTQTGYDESLPQSSVLVTRVNDRLQRLSATTNQSSNGVSFIVDSVEYGDDELIADQSIYDISGSELLAVVSGQSIDDSTALRLERFTEGNGRSVGYDQTTGDASWNPSSEVDLIVEFPVTNLSQLATFEGADIYATGAGTMTVRLDSRLAGQPNYVTRATRTVELEVGWNRVSFGAIAASQFTDMIAIRLVHNGSSGSIGIDLSTEPSGHTWYKTQYVRFESGMDANIKGLYRIDPELAAMPENEEEPTDSGSSGSSDSGSSGGGSGYLLILISLGLLLGKRRSRVQR